MIGGGTRAIGHPIAVIILMGVHSPHPNLDLALFIENVVDDLTLNDEETLALTEGPGVIEGHCICVSREYVRGAGDKTHGTGQQLGRRAVQINQPRHVAYVQVPHGARRVVGLQERLVKVVVHAQLLQGVGPGREVRQARVGGSQLPSGVTRSGVQQQARLGSIGQVYAGPIRIAGGQQERGTQHQ